MILASCTPHRFGIKAVAHSLVSVADSIFEHVMDLCLIRQEASIAQLVEQVLRKDKVGGSSPS